MSYLHTHGSDGLVHIEAGTRGQPFTLGQLFTQWDVRLGRDQMGGLVADRGTALSVYVNCEKASGNSATLRLRPHQQIALVYGQADQKLDVPAGCDFAPGE